jgi:hypothetical protein
MARMYLNSISLSICFSYIKFEFFFALKAGEARVNGKNVSQTFGSGRCRVRRNVATVLSLSLSVSLSLCVCVCVCVCACVYKYVHISGGTERWAEVHHGVWTSVYAKTRTARSLRTQREGERGGRESLLAYYLPPPSSSSSSSWYCVSWHHAPCPPLIHKTLPPSLPPSLPLSIPHSPPTARCSVWRHTRRLLTLD